jgi:hypothetical protein
MRPQRSVVFLPEGFPALASLEVSASRVAELVGSNELVATETAPPRTVVSRPPLAVVRVAQPEANNSEARAAETISFDFMGSGEAEDWTLMDKRSFKKLQGLALAPVD